MANKPYSTDPKKVFATFKTYARGGAFPLDDSSVFNTYADLNTYITETGSYAYAGQIVAVANGTIDASNGGKEYNVYVIRSDKSLQPLGTNKSFASLEAVNTFFAASTGVSFAGEVITVLNANNKYDLYTVGPNNVLSKASFDAATDTIEESNGYASVTVDGTPALTATSVTDAIALASGANVRLATQDGKIVFNYEASELTKTTNEAVVKLGKDSTFKLVVPTLDATNNVTGWTETQYQMPDVGEFIAGDAVNGNVLYYDESVSGWVQGSAADAGLATSDDLNSVLSTNSAMLFKGAIDVASFTALSGQENGWTYYVSEAGEYGDNTCEVGDLIIWDNTNSKWIAVQVNITGAVSGPATATPGAIAVFDGATGKLIKDSGIVLPAEPKFTDTTYEAFNGSKDGLVPVEGADQGGFLKADGTWAEPVGTTYDAFNGSKDALVPAAGAEAGKVLSGDGSWVTPVTYEAFDGSKDGLVPVEGADQGCFLKADGTWAVPENTTYEVFNNTTAGLVPAGTVEGGFLRADGQWTTPKDTTYDVVTAEKAGLAPAIGAADTTKAFLRADGTWEIPENTTYDVFTGSTAGLVPEVTGDDNAGKFLAADGSWVKVSSSFEGLTDTTITNAAEGDLVVFDAASGKWVNKTLANAGVVATSDFTAEKVVEMINTQGGVESDTLGGHDASYFAPVENAALTGVPTAPTADKATSTTQIATTEFVQTVVTDKLAVADAMTYKGVLNGGTADSTAYTPAAEAGDTYKVGTAGYINGIKVNVGDLFICKEDGTIAAINSNYTIIQAKWDHVPTAIEGTVISSETAVADGDLVVFDGVTGNIIKKLALTAGKVLVADENGKLTASTVDADKLEALGNVEGNIDEVLDSKADAENAALTGTPTAPTAEAGTSTTQIATTEFVQNAVESVTITAEPSRALMTDESGEVCACETTSTELGYLSGTTSNVQTQLDAKAPLESPALTGTPTVPTATAGTNTTQAASTEFVQTAVQGLVPVVVSAEEPTNMPQGGIWMDIQNQA